MILQIILGAVAGAALAIMASVAIFLRRSSEYKEMETSLSQARRETLDHQEQKKAAETQVVNKALQLSQVTPQLEAALQAKREAEAKVEEFQCELEAIKTSTKSVLAANTEKLQKEINKEKANATRLITRADSADQTIQGLRAQIVALQQRIDELSSSLANEQKAKETIQQEKEALQKAAESTQSVLAEARQRTADANTKARNMHQLLKDAMKKAETITKEPEADVTKLNKDVPLTGILVSGPMPIDHD